MLNLINRKKNILLIIIVITVAIFLLRKRIQRTFYDLQEYYVIKNSIEWSLERKLKWSDFIYDAEKKYADDIYARVEISHRYHLNDRIDSRSITLFIPDKSFVTDTTNQNALRIAQARFDLCELYRRKFNIKIQKLRERNVNEVSGDTLRKYGEYFYDKFENEWSIFMDLEYRQLNKGLLELEKRIEEELK